ncbi:MAG: hypothetical protein JWQ96_211 [Segetibacter sp.]|nr:hypothetical protein [Segetibacter sp.]
MNSLKKMTTLAMATVLLSTSAFAQDAKEKTKTDKKSQDIIIRNNGATEKMTIVVDGEDVTINGKPVKEFKGNNVSVITRSHTSPAIASLNGNINGGYATTIRGNKAKLGVATEKADGGAKVTAVTKESAAEKAGLKEGDVITKIGDTKIEGSEDLIAAIGKYKANDKVDVTYKRNNKENRVSATLGENKSAATAYGFGSSDFNFDIPRVMSPGPDGFGTFFTRKPKIGLEIQDVEEGKGAKVNDVDDESPAAKAGLKEGDVITTINGKEIEGVDAVREQIKDIKEGDNLKFGYKRNGSNQIAEVKIPKKLKTASL